MPRRSSALRIGGLVVAALVIFVPIAAASNADRATETLTLLSLVGALAVCGLAWFLLRQHGFVRAAYLGLAALVGALAPALLLGLVHDFDGVPRDALLSRLFLISAITAAGFWLFIVALRWIFPRRARGLATGAVVLTMVALAPAPALLLQPGVALLNVIDVRQQLHAGVMYWTTGTILLVLPFLALTTVPGDWFERWWSDITARVMEIPNRAFAMGVVAVVLLLAVGFTWYSFDARPTTADEIAQLWHGRMLLGGHLALPADPNPEFFAIDNVIDRPRWMSQFPIGGPAVLAVGLLTGVAWLLNPLLTALTALNVYRFVQRTDEEATARAAAAVYALSPMVLLMGSTYMNHTPTAWLVTLALAALPNWIADPDPAGMRRSALLIGGALGCAVTIRPLDGVVAGAVIALVMLAAAVRDRRRASTLLLGVGAGAIPLALLLLANLRTTGSATRFGYEVLWGPNHSLGLHDDPTGHPHTAWRALLLGVKYAVQMNWIATAWPIPVMVVVVAGMFAALRPRRWDIVLFALFGTQLLLYAFYWHDGQFVGPRFMFTALAPLLILAARAPFVVAHRVRGVAWRATVLAVPVCIGVTWLRHMPPFGVQGLASEFRESRTRLKLDPPREITSGLVQNALVFVQEGAATRLLHRLWGVGVSRAASARLVETADACSLLEAVRAEEARPSPDSVTRLDRIAARVTPYREGRVGVHIPDPNFRVSDETSLTTACRVEIALDNRLKNTVAYGPLLLLNRFDSEGRVGGNAVYVMNLGERNEVLRQRFADRHWYLYEVPRNRPDTLPILVPYDSAR